VEKKSMSDLNLNALSSELNNDPYTEDYKNKCFTMWYMLGKPKIGEIVDKIPADEHGRIPTKFALSRWRNQEGWDWRADILDTRVQSEVDNQLVATKVLMLKEQASKGRELQVLGMEHIRENGFDSTSSAVAAVIKGADMEKTSRGLSDALLKIAHMTEDQLKESIMGLLTRESEAETIEGEFKIEDKETKSLDEDMTP
jgi:hypothetical protein